MTSCYDGLVRYRGSYQLWFSFLFVMNYISEMWIYKNCYKDVFLWKF